MKRKVISRKTVVPLLYIYGVFVVVFIFWLAYRYLTHFSDIIDELLAKPFIWIVPILFVWFAHSKHNFLSLFSINNLTWGKILLGVGGGIVLVALQIIPLMANGNAKFHIPPGLLSLTLATVGTAITEEVLFRGFIFKQFQNYYSSITNFIITSLLFAVIHVPILLFINGYSGNSLLVPLYILFINSLLFCWLYYYTKNLWVAILAHFIIDVLLLIY